jgi:hypothetical protein
VTEGREEERGQGAREEPIRVPITIQYGERRETTMAEEGKGEEEIKTWARNRWRELNGKELEVREVEGRMGTHAGASYRVEERRTAEEGDWDIISLTQNGRIFQIRVRKGASDQEIRETAEKERNLRPGKYIWEQEGTGKESKIRVESGTYVITVKEGRRSTTVIGHPRTTLEEIRTEIQNRWGLEAQGWRLEWGGGEFKTRDKMEIRIEREVNPDNEQVEVIMVKGRDIRQT